MFITINEERYELYIGDREYEWQDAADGKREFVAIDDKELDAFIKAIGDKKGVLFTNYSFSDDDTHYHGGDYPAYRINGYREELSEDEAEFWSREEIELSNKKYDRTLEQVKVELLKHDNVQAMFVEDGFGECGKAIYYAGEDGCFHLGSDDIFGWA